MCHFAIKLLFNTKEVNHNFIITSSIFGSVENRILGIKGNIIKLPIIKEPKLEKNIVKVTDIKQYIDEHDSTYDNAICQHFIDWDNLRKLRNYNPNKYNELIFQLNLFNILKYVNKYIEI